MDELWEKFIKSGKIEDYLKYKRLWDEEYADEGQGLNNKGTNNRGE